MSRSPSQAVIEAVEQAEREHHWNPYAVKCACGWDAWGGLDEQITAHRRAEVARAAEAAALRAAAERMDDLSRGAPLAAAITARAAAIRLDHWADELTDTDDGSK